MLASTLLAAKAGGKVPAGARRGGMTSAWMKVGSKVEQLPSLERSYRRLRRRLGGGLDVTIGGPDGQQIVRVLADHRASQVDVA